MRRNRSMFLPPLCDPRDRRACSFPARSAWPRVSRIFPSCGLVIDIGACVVGSDFPPIGERALEIVGGNRTGFLVSPLIAEAKTHRQIPGLNEIDISLRFLGGVGVIDRRWHPVRKNSCAMPKLRWAIHLWLARCGDNHFCGSRGKAAFTIPERVIFLASEIGLDDVANEMRPCPPPRWASAVQFALVSCSDSKAGRFLEQISARPNGSLSFKVKA